MVCLCIVCSLWMSSTAKYGQYDKVSDIIPIKNIIISCLVLVCQFCGFNRIFCLFL